jgi:hypothetical protein
MRTRSCIWVLLLLFPLTAQAQNLYQKKDLAFAQVAAGGGYVTVINVTNRGPDIYAGVLNLFHQTTAGPQAWNPLVNGNQIANGRMDVSINAGATVTYQVTEPGGTEAGFAVFVADDLSLRSFLEGNLTYYYTSGAAFDSVGVQPSSEFYLTRIPFDDFSTLAMALANLNTSGVTAKLTVYSSTGAQVATLNQPLGSGEHIATYLRQLFPDLQMASGRLEIQSSSLPIIGTILTDIDNQLSSLPMLPAVKAYTFTGTIAGFSYSGEISFWFDGFFVQGYIRVLNVGGIPEQLPDTLPFTGNLINGVLQVTATGSATADNQLLSYVLINPYSPSQATMQGSAALWGLPSYSLVGTGTLTLQAIN